MKTYYVNRDNNFKSIFWVITDNILSMFKKIKLVTSSGQLTSFIYKIRI